MSRIWLVSGALSGFIAVATGAFGAHALSERLSTKALSIWNTAAQYQMYHALALIALGVYAHSVPHVSTSIPGWSFLLGTVIFSGSLYALALTDVKILGAITPIGGLGFLIAWLSFALVAAGWIGSGRSY